MSYVHATTVIGYTADASHFCSACAHLVYDRWEGRHMNVRHHATDREGNVIAPVFASDDAYGNAVCDRCGETLDEWTAEL